jgi:hypothetical protein
MDMDGHVLHRWARNYWSVWPDSDIERDHRGSQHWRRARILPGGDLLAIYDGLGIVKLDRASNLIWANHCGAHHDLEVLPDGDYHPAGAVVWEFFNPHRAGEADEYIATLFEVLRLPDDIAAEWVESAN